MVTMFNIQLWNIWAWMYEWQMRKNVRNLCSDICFKINVTTILTLLRRKQSWVTTSLNCYTVIRLWCWVLQTRKQIQSQETIKPRWIISALECSPNIEVQTRLNRDYTKNNKTKINCFQSLHCAPKGQQTQDNIDSISNSVSSLQSTISASSGNLHI